MKRNLLAVALLFLLAFPQGLRADQTVTAVQQALKEQGFYYGAVSGEKNVDTTAAIRRFQIRNGLQINGEINAETLRALGVGGGAPRAAVTTPRSTPALDTSDLRDSDSTTRSNHVSPTPAQAYNPQRSAPPPDGFSPGPHGLRPEISGVFNGTPYEIAPPDLQQHVIVGAQVLLARRGLYRGSPDGTFGPATESAVRALQSRLGFAPSGRLDMETLAALGLLPGQHAPGISVPPRRFERPSRVYRGEQVPY